MENWKIEYRRLFRILKTPLEIFKARLLATGRFVMAPSVQMTIYGKLTRD